MMLKDMRPIRGKYLIERLIAEGEHQQQDFKFTISDARKIARSLSAFANNEGGRLLVGVKDNGVIAGVRSDEDLYMLESAAELYCTPVPALELKAYKATDEGAVVIVATVEPHGGAMVHVKEEGGVLRAYYRVADENIVAPELMVRSRALRASGAGMLLNLNDVERRILEEVTSGPIQPERLMTRVTASRATVTDSLTKLLAIEALSLTYIHGHFHLTV